MKKQTFIVTVEFSDKISDDNDILEIATNIAHAIVAETNGLGIAPQNGDAYAVSVNVKPEFINESITEKTF